MRVRKQQLELAWNNRLVPNWERVRQGCVLSSWLFNLYAEDIMRNTGLDEAQAGVKIAGRNINNLRYADDTTLMAESEEELKRDRKSTRLNSSHNVISRMPSSA